MSFKDYIKKTTESDCKITNFLNGRDFDIKITKEHIRLFTKPEQIPGQIIHSFGVSYLEFDLFKNSEGFIEFLFMLRDTPKEQRRDLEKSFLVYQSLNLKGCLLQNPQADLQS